MTLRMTSPSQWADLGRRMTAARTALGHSLAWLAEHTRVSISDLTEIEGGVRGPRPGELARIASALTIRADWFTTESPPTVRSLRAERIEGLQVARSDLLLEQMARDVEQLVLLRVLSAPERRIELPMPRELAEAERAAQKVRTELQLTPGPLLELDSIGEKLGVYTYCVKMKDQDPDGTYIALENGGVVLVNGGQEPGRRRFTLAHELGHHVFQDPYSTDWLGASAHNPEALVNAFAVHLLLPRDAVTSRWQQLSGHRDPRAAALRLGVEYRVSWSVICAQSKRLGLIDQCRYDELVTRTPDGTELRSHGLDIEAELVPPSLSPGFKQAVIAAYRRNRITPTRATEMLRGTLDANRLPESDRIPLDAYRSEIESL